MPSKKLNRSLKKLPQSSESWRVTFRKLKIWVAPDDEEARRPYVVLVLNVETGLMQQMDLTKFHPTAADILTILQRAMQEPLPGLDFKPHRPQMVILGDKPLTETLTPTLEDVGTTVMYSPDPPEIDNIVRDMEQSMRDKPEPPGLLSIKGVTPAKISHLFNAAANFYRAAPWIHVTDTQTLAIQAAPENTPRFVQIMGGGGIEYGLAMYRQWEDVERIFGFADNPLELLPPDGGHSLTFNDITMVPFDDLDDIETHGWEPANDQAYPVPLLLTQKGIPQRPTLEDLQWYEAALQAIPIFFRDHLQPDKPAEKTPVEATLSVTTSAGKTNVTVKYPAGTIPVETHPVNMGDWPGLGDDDDLNNTPPFDMRAMESLFSLMETDLDDPDLEDAQDLMYDAWEESNPAKRIILAHEALTISPNCADAYVLLAQEEADTLKRALDLYKEGVAAGERALGKEYFEENKGHFWGLIETRPYMRACQGLATLLWEMERYDEAAEHFQDMLQLNPGDNQGIRYSLLNLLVITGQDTDALALLESKEYGDDGMAEWVYTRALLAFKKEGAKKTANDHLKKALKINPHVPPYLTGRKRIPVKLPQYIGYGDKNEAIMYASQYLSHWRRTAGAVDWLKTQIKPARKAKRVKKSGTRKPKKS